MFKRKANRPMPAFSPMTVVREKAGKTTDCFTGSDYMRVHWRISMIVSDKLTVMRSQGKNLDCFRPV